MFKVFQNSLYVYHKHEDEVVPEEQLNFLFEVW